MTKRGRFDQLPAEEIYSGVVRCSFNSEHATVTSYVFAPGAVFPLHHHPQEQITLMQEGTAEMTAGDGVESLSSGDWTIVDAYVEHGLRAGPNGARFLAIVAPRRESANAYTVLDSDGRS